MPDGYETLYNVINNLGEQTGWNERNRLAPIDWKATLSKFFSKNRPVSQTPNTGNTQQFSADNPYTKVKPSGNTFFEYRESPELQRLKMQFENDKYKENLAKQLADIQLQQGNLNLETGKKQLELLGREEVVDPLDKAKKEAELEKLLKEIDLLGKEKATNPLDDELKRSQIIKNLRVPASEVTTNSNGFNQKEANAFLDNVNNSYKNYLAQSGVIVRADGKLENPKGVSVMSQDDFIRKGLGEQAYGKYKYYLSGGQMSQNEAISKQKNQSLETTIKNGLTYKPEKTITGKNKNPGKNPTGTAIQVLMVAMSKREVDPAAKMKELDKLIAKYNQENGTKYTRDNWAVQVFGKK